MPPKTRPAKRPSVDARLTCIEERCGQRLSASLRRRLARCLAWNDTWLAEGRGFAVPDQTEPAELRFRPTPASGKRGPRG